MIKYKAIFDTNSIRNDKLNEFFGSQKSLKEVSKFAEIIIPSMVYDEIKIQKEKHFIENKDKLIKNHLFSISNFEKDAIIDFNDKLKNLKDNIDFQFNVISVEDKTKCLEFIKERAIYNKSPFDKGSDKGFKDCYIVYTVREYIEKNKSDSTKFILCTKDVRFKEAISELMKEIEIVDSIDAIKSNTIFEYKDNYFIEKLKNEFGLDLFSGDQIKGVYFNTEYNDILEVVINDKEHLVHVSEREILGIVLKNDVDQSIQAFEKSPSFAETHLRVAQLKKYYDYFGSVHIERVSIAVTKNSQICYIIQDDDIKEFLLDIKDFSEKVLDEKTYSEVFDPLFKKDISNNDVY